MYRFEHPYWLLGIVVLLLLFIYFIFDRNYKIKKAKQVLYIENTIWEALLDMKKHVYKHGLLLLSGISILIALANPQKKGTPKWEEQESREIVFALDLSNSMLAEDIKPNRLEHAKSFLKHFAKQNTVNQLGLIVFAGQAYMQIPLTKDYGSFAMHVDKAHPNQIATQGTVIANAIQRAQVLFNSNSLNNKALVIISDGEDHEKNAIAEAKNLTKNGITIYTIGVGSLEGAKIWDEDLQSYKKDKEGNDIVSIMNTSMLEDLASAGNGKYLHLNNITQTSNTLNRMLENIKGDTVQTWMPGIAKSYSFLFIIISICLLLFYNFQKFFDFKITDKKSKIFGVLLLVICPMFLHAQEKKSNSSISILQQRKARSEIRKGDEAYSVNDFQLAQEKYRTAANILQINPAVKWREGNASYRNENWELARKSYEAQAKNENANLKERFSGNYNAGNTYMQEENWEEAIHKYKEALRLNPNNQQAKYNLSYAMLKKKEQENQENNDDQNEDDEEEKENEEDEDQNESKDDEDNNENDKAEQEKEEDKGNEDSKPESKLSPEQAERILDALQEAEKDAMDKEKGEQSRGVKIEKDW